MAKQSSALVAQDTDAAASGGGVQYSLVFLNNSSNAGSACVYQTDPTITNPYVMSLAWFAQMAAPTTKVVFTWTINYSFVWAQTGQLIPGVMFVASQNWSADLSTTNQVTFTYPGYYTFKNQTAGAQTGTLYITEDNTIPLNQASVGIGMSGAGTFAVQAQPNMNLMFTPHPVYWITFGNFSAGEVLDITQITNSAQISFPPNVYSMTAILNADNTWTVSTTQAANEAYANARTQLTEFKWGMSISDALSLKGRS